MARFSPMTGVSTVPRSAAAPPQAVPPKRAWDNQRRQPWRPSPLPASGRAPIVRIPPSGRRGIEGEGCSAVSDFEPRIFNTCRATVHGKLT